jgi:hypothetical protein
MSGRKHHVHANIHRIGPDTASRLEQAGFMLDPFIETKNSYTPPIHYSLECDDTNEARKAWNQAHSLMQDDADFTGYIEFETLTAGFEVDLTSLIYNPPFPFPLPQFSLSEVPPDKHKHADLHVKRPATWSIDGLDAELIRTGFYEVNTERNRIYTLQCEAASDANQVFLILRDFLNIAGGAMQVNFEVIGRFVRKPYDFRVARYLPVQSDHVWMSLSERLDYQIRSLEGYS